MDQMICLLLVMFFPKIYRFNNTSIHIEDHISIVCTLIEYNNKSVLKNIDKKKIGRQQQKQKQQQQKISETQY